MLDTRTQPEKDADAHRVSLFIERLGVTEATPVGLVAAFESFDSSFRILVAVGMSALDGNAKHLVIERHRIPAVERSERPGINWRDQFRLVGTYYCSGDPTFIGFVTPAADSWRRSIDALESGQMRVLPLEGLKLFERPIK